MSDLQTALEALEDALRDLRRRMALTDPRRARINALLFLVGEKMGGGASAALIARIAALVSLVEALFGSGDFGAIMTEAEDAVSAVSDP